MFKRRVIVELKKWAKKAHRKPLLLRGARQVGKTTVVNEFARDYKQYVYLNMELEEDARPFKQFKNVDALLQALFFLKGQRYSRKKNTLIFIDEIQEVPEAFKILRYLYEKRPAIHIIAAGSLLETIFSQKPGFPVGRVEFLVVRPVSFPEFIDALGENAAMEELKHIPFRDFALPKLMELFHTYALIGGMPEVVQEYASSRDLTQVASLYEGLITSYIDDVEKYAKNPSQVNAIRHVIRSSYSEAGKRIKYQGFGKSAYGSREMGEALRTLEKALILSLIHPCTSANLPLMPELQKSPRLHLLDTGMVNYFLGIQKEIIGTDDLSSIYQGSIIEHLVGQELLATQFNALSKLNFWVREKKTSSAEVDYLYPYKGRLIPIEVKSGKSGKLRSLHLFMSEAPHRLAIRFYAGGVNIQIVATQYGPEYYLLSLPYFLVSQIENYLAWFEMEVKKLS